jgi:hypothetical protein
MGAHQKGDFDNEEVFQNTGIPDQDCPIVQAILKRYLELVIRCKCVSAFTAKRKRDASSDLAVWGPVPIGPDGADVYGVNNSGKGIGPISCPGETRMKKLRLK